MSEWAAKRFWKVVAVAEVADGFTVTLDGRHVKTPAKTPFLLPTKALAEAAAEEWDAQDGKIQPETMPVTRAANSAIDRVAPQIDEVAALLAEYGATDLLCYRAESPESLVARQAAGWDPLLDWADEALGARLKVASGVIPTAQDVDTLARLSNAVRAFGPFELAAFHDLVSLPGSLVLGFAVARGKLAPNEAWALARIDEDWQIEQWGADEEASEHAALKAQAFRDAARFFSLTQQG